MLEEKAWSQSPLQVIPKVLNEVEDRALCEPVKLFHTKLIKPCLHSPYFASCSTVMLEQKRAFTQLLLFNTAPQLSFIMLYTYPSNA